MANGFIEIRRFKRNWARLILRSDRGTVLLIGQLVALDALGLAMLELCNQCGSPQCYRIARDQDTWAAELTSSEGHLLARSYPQLSPSDAQALISLAIDQGPHASVGWSMAEDSSR